MCNQTNITHIINGYKKMFEISNLLYDLLDKQDLDHLRDLVNYVTAPVFISEVDTPDKDIYKTMFLSTIRNLATKKLNENEQRLIVYASDFVNIYLSI